MNNQKLSITDQKCPGNKGGGVHHLTPRSRDRVMVLACITCKKTEAELREELNGSSAG